ncbi:MAG: FimV/HubP family polar landmark protein [Gammaproteobacteria bacterium]
MKLKRFTTQLVAAGLVALPLWAQAAGLGRLSVNSALGQPLTAEIEIFAADKAELESLSASLASDQAFRDARVDFAPVLSTLRFAIEKRPGNKAVLKVTSSRPVTDPFIDMLVELNWASGRLVREYTLLLDPPGMAKPQTVAPVAVATPAAPVPAPAPAPAAAPAPATTPAPAAAPAPKAAAPAPAEKPAKPAAPDSVTVKKGDTLSGIASRVRPEGVSLEQTLVGLYRENTEAFNGNLNRLKSGKTLTVPSAEQVAAIPQAEAVREIKLQADDWRAYRQRLAAAVEAAPEADAAPGTAASGKVSPKVEDRAKPAPEAQKDVLKLSKAAPAANGKAAAEAASLREQVAAQEAKLRAQEEDATAREKSLQEANQRVALLEKQVADMQKLVAMKEKALADAAKPAQAPEPAPAAEPAPEPAPAAEAAAPAPEVKPEEPAAPVPAVPVAKLPVAPAESEAGWYEPLLANPLYWGGGLAAVGLGGVLWWMMAGGRRRKTSSTTVLDDSLLPGHESKPISVIGASSGGSVNTGDTSFLTDFSQAGLGTIDTHDVDPIAEAEVYMAYGRDAQAEEILKEAIVKNPDRHEVRVKLLEIYAARRNTAAFASVAGELYAALGSDTHPLWDKVCEMGREIDPTNPLYGGGGGKGGEAPAAAVAATAAVAGGAVVFGGEAEAAAPAAAESEPEPETRFEAAPMDFSVPEIPAVETPTFEAPAFEPAPVVEEPAKTPMDLDFELPDLDLPTAGDDTLKLDLGMEDETGPDSKFDFSGLDLDLGESGGSELELDEVGTKLDLARAYVEMGDKEGAREILNEVIAEGNDKQKSDAQGMLSSLG